MNARRIFTLVKKEFFYGSKNFIFVMALVMPVVITLAISLLSRHTLLGQAAPGHSRPGRITATRPDEAIRLSQHRNLHK